MNVIQLVDEEVTEVVSHHLTLTVSVQHLLHHSPGSCRVASNVVEMLPDCVRCGRLPQNKDLLVKLGPVPHITYTQLFNGFFLGEPE